MSSYANEEETIFELRPSFIMAIDGWVFAAIWALLSLVFIPQVFVVLELLLGPVSWLKTAFPYAWILSFALVPWALWKHIENRCTVYEITSQRLIRRTGVLNAVYDEVELSRVRDFQVEFPFYLRMLGLGNVHVWSTDRNTPKIEIEAQEDAKKLRNELRQLMLRRQAEMGYREFEAGAG